MIASDFEFDGEYLSDYGFVICNTDQSSGFEAINSNPQMNFECVEFINGKLFGLIAAKYNDKISFQFQICKYEKTFTTLLPICTSELRNIKRWLNRPTFKKFKLLQPEWSNIYMEGSFNISEELGFDGNIYILNLTFESNRPFALSEPITYKTELSKAPLLYTIIDISDEIGHIYPDIKITCLQDDDLEIKNSNENRVTIVRNCKNGEIITFSKELLVSSSNKDHKVQNDFNYIFPRISNSYKNRNNILTFSIPVKMELTYSPYVKVVS